MWVSFLWKKLYSAIKNCNNSSTPELYKLFWKYLKVITKNKNCINRLIDITNAYINLGHWLDHFKMLSMVIIPKLNKPSCYDSKTLEWVNKKNLILGLTQENSIESSLQSSLPYIPIYMVYASYWVPYPKVPCVRHEVNIWYTCCMMSLLLEPSISFYVFYDLSLSLSPDVTCFVTVWSCHSNPNPSSKNRIKENKLKIK